MPCGYLGMKRAAEKIVPKLSKFEEKERRMDVAQEILMTNHGCMAVTSQWKRPEYPRLKKARQVRSNIKVFGAS